ncbi:hypothetical protein NMY22_g8755 [Coprinellus aureogranulatus]|nr:hypothetical protein NMY22_g8755 [Coprinellus aureogranulatus]
MSSPPGAFPSPPRAEPYTNIEDILPNVIWLVLRGIIGLIFGLISLVIHSIIFLFAVFGAFCGATLVMLFFVWIPKIDFTHVDVRFLDSKGELQILSDLAEVQHAQARFAQFGVMLGMVWEPEVRLGSGASKWLDLAAPRSLANETVHYSSSGFYVRKGQYLKIAPLTTWGHGPPRPASPAYAAPVAGKVNEKVDSEPSPAMQTYKYCLAKATEPNIRCTPECREVFAPKPDAGYRQKIIHSLECLGT